MGNWFKSKLEHLQYIFTRYGEDIFLYTMLFCFLYFLFNAHASTILAKMDRNSTNYLLQELLFHYMGPLKETFDEKLLMVILDEVTSSYQGSLQGHHARILLDDYLTHVRYRTSKLLSFDIERNVGILISRNTDPEVRHLTETILFDPYFQRSPTTFEIHLALLTLIKDNPDYFIERGLNELPMRLVGEHISDNIGKYLAARDQMAFYKEHNMFYLRFREAFLGQHKLSFTDFLNYSTANVSDETKKAIEAFNKIVYKK